MVTYALKMSERDLELLKEYAESVGSTPAQLIRECVRCCLARGGMLGEEDAERVLNRCGIRPSKE